MLIRVREPEAVPALVRALRERVDYVVQQLADDRIAVSVLGSYADGGEAELTAFLHAYQTHRPELAAEVAAR